MCPCVGRFNTYSSFGQSGAKGFSSYQIPSSCLLPLQSRRIVGSLSILYRYFHANCSSELSNCMAPLLSRPRSTRLSTQDHSSTVQTPYAIVNQYLLSFFPFTGKLYNSLPASVFPPVYDLSAFKSGVSRHLCNPNGSLF